jgi:putative endonuclease
MYILYSKDKDRYYVGHTENLESRLADHNIRKNLGATDWEVRYTESFSSRGEAMKREYEIKSKKKRTYLEFLIKGAN